MHCHHVGFCSCSNRYSDATSTQKNQLSFTVDVDKLDLADLLRLHEFLGNCSDMKMSESMADYDQVTTVILDRLKIPSLPANLAERLKFILSTE